MVMPLSTPNVPMGYAFEIADLMLLQGWAEFHEVHMVVELDHCVEGEEYEEVIAFYAKDSQLRRWILWRAASEIVVQPLIEAQLPVRDCGRGTGRPDAGPVVAGSSGQQATACQPVMPEKARRGTAEDRDAFVV